MTKSALTYRFCDPQYDRPAVVDLLDTQRAELQLKDRQAVAQIIDTAFERGGIFAGYNTQGEPHAMGGYFLGDPVEQYVDPKVGFVYVAAISSAYRLTRAFYAGLRFCLQGFQEMGLHTFRLQAKADDQYTNKLYNRFAHVIGESESLRGHKVIRYGISVEEGLAYFERGKRPLKHTLTHSTPFDAQHAAGLRRLPISSQTR